MRFVRNHAKYFFIIRQKIIEKKFLNDFDHGLLYTQIIHTILYTARTYLFFLSHLAIIKAICQDSSILFIIAVVYNSFSSNVV